MTGCRISAVRMKNGGAEIKILHTDKHPENDFAMRILRDCMDIARSEKVTSLSICLDTHNTLYTPFMVDAEGKHTEAIGACDRMKEKLLRNWLDD